MSLDTRNDLYGPRRVIAEQELVRHGGNAGALARAGCVLVPANSGLARQLYHGQGWRARASDAAAVLFVRY